MKRTSTPVWMLGLAALLVLPFLAHATIVIGPGEPDGISPVFVVDTEGAQRETFIAINPANNLNLVMGWNERSAGRTSGQGFVSTFNYGATWGVSGEIPGGVAASDPALMISPTGGPLGTAVFTYINNDFTGVRCFRSFDGGVTFPVGPIMVQPDTGPGGPGTDKNWCVCDLVPTSPGFDNMYLTVTEFGGTAADSSEDAIVMAVSFDQGATWPIQSLKLDTPADGRIVTGSNLDAFGSTGATWHVWWEGPGPTPAPFDIQASTRVAGGGAAIFLPYSIPVAGAPSLPALTPIPAIAADFYGSIANGGGASFRANSFPYVAIDTNPASPFFRNVYIVSANSTAAFLGGGTDPDIMLWRHPAAAFGGTLVGTTVRNGIPILNSAGGAGDQVFPSITVAPDGAVEVFWLDTRNDPGGPTPRARFDIYYTCSRDGGMTWSPNVRISPATFTHAGNTFIGDYDDSTTNRGGAPGGGGHTWRSYVVQAAGGAGTNPVVQAVNNTAPAAMLTGPANIDCAAAGVPALFDASATTDVDGDPITYTWTITSMFPAPGFPFATNTGSVPTLNHVLPLIPLSGNTYTTTVTATDFFGAFRTATVVTTVTDTTPPMVNSGITRNILWLARNGMTNVGFTYGAMDDCDPAPAKIVSVYSNEANGAAPFTPDASVLGATLYLRAERAFPGTGRIYVTRLTATDAAGNAAWSCRSAIVPLYAITSHIVALQATAAAAEAACQASPVDVAPPGAPNAILVGAPLP